MFRLKGFSFNPSNQNKNTRSDKYEDVRTLKKDYEDFEERKQDQTDRSENPPHSGSPSLPTAPPANKKPEERDVSHSPFPPSYAKKSSYREQSAEFPSPPASLTSSYSSPQSDSPSSMKIDRRERNISEDTTELYQPALSDKKISTKSEIPATIKKGSAGKLIFVVIVILILIITGAGFYYYWFFIRESAQPKAEPLANVPSASESEPGNLRHLSIDTSLGKGEIKTAVNNFADELSASSLENNLLEVKPVDKNNQKISFSDFASGFNLIMPTSIWDKLSNEYSLFFSKEDGSEIKMGLVLKTTDANLVEDLRIWEDSIISDLSPLYLGRLSSLTSETLFSSSKYGNADIRYYNFLSPENTSLDYSLISDSKSSYLIIATSKNAMRSIIDYMTEEQPQSPE